MTCSQCRGKGIIYRTPGLHGGSPTPCPVCSCPVESDMREQVNQQGRELVDQMNAHQGKK